MKTLGIFMVLIFPFIAFPQEWVRIYGDNISCYAYSLMESYDRGYVYGGVIDQGQIPKYGWIFKTDINGEMLWDKKIGEYGDATAIHDVKQSIDGGYILIGDTRKLDPYYDPFVMKLNTCGELEWCRILNLPGNMDFGTRIIQLPNGNYVALLTYFSYNNDERIWLMCFNENGDTLWKKVYAQTEPDIINEDGFHLLLTSDSSILITGIGSYPDSGTTLYRNRPLLIKTDFEGNEKWTLPWGYTQSFKGHGVMSVVDYHGNIFTVGRHIRNQPNYGYSPTFLKTTNNGTEISYWDVNDSTELGMSTTISWFSDSTFIIGTGWRLPGEDVIEAVIKVDTTGNIITMKEIIETSNTFQGSIVDFDNKAVVMGGFYMDGNWDIYAYKFNQDLEFDTIYTQPFVYDSLCPYPIVSDTIPLDCVIVGLEEPIQEERTQLMIIPNPARDKIKVLLPEYISWQFKSAGFNVTTWKYNYKGDIPLEIYDIYGRRWYSEVIPGGEKETEIDISTLPTGIYVVQVVIEGQAVSGKVVIE
jgi:hypothetical protein